MTLWFVFSFASWREWVWMCLSILISLAHLCSSACGKLQIKKQTFKRNRLWGDRELHFSLWFLVHLKMLKVAPSILGCLCHSMKHVKPHYISRELFYSCLTMDLFTKHLIHSTKDQINLLIHCWFCRFITWSPLARVFDLTRSLSSLRTSVHLIWKL